MAQGQLTIEELVDRYRLQYTPIRNLIVNYPARTAARLGLRQPGRDLLLPGRPVLGQDRGSVPEHQHAAPAPGNRPRLEGRPADRQAHRHRCRRRADRDLQPAAERQRRTAARAGALSRHRPVGHRGALPLGAMGSSLPGQRHRDQPHQGPQAPQGPDGPADPRAATRPARAHPHRRRAQGRCRPAAAGRPGNAARRGNHRHQRDAPQGRHPEGRSRRKLDRHPAEALEEAGFLDVGAHANDATPTVGHDSELSYRCDRICTHCPPARSPDTRSSPARTANPTTGPSSPNSTSPAQPRRTPAHEAGHDRQRVPGRRSRHRAGHHHEDHKRIPGAVPGRAGAQHARVPGPVSPRYRPGGKR
jgi:hypothetical protein